MGDKDLTLWLKLKDDATKGLASVRGGIIAAGAAIGAAGFTAGKKWDEATKTIVDGTGAVGDALKGLQDDYQAVARYGDDAAKVIADLNTHLGLEGEALRTVAEAALKAKVDTNLFGDVAAQLGLDAQGTTHLLDDLVFASQATGVSVDQMTKGIGKNSARWQAAGGDMGDLAALVVQLSDEFGPSGLRGAMSEIMEEVDKGLIPTVASLDRQLGNTTGAVERTYEAGKTWRDTLRETKDAALAAIGPYGDVAGALGSTVSALALAGPQMISLIKGTKLATGAQKLWNIAMNLNPIGLIITAVGLAGLAIYTWRDQIFGFLRGAWTALVSGFETGYNAIARIVPRMEEVELSTWKFEPAAEAAAVAVEHLAVEAEPVPSILDQIGVTAVTATEPVDTFTGTIEDSSAALGFFGLKLDGIGVAVKPIPPFLSTLTGTIEDQSAAVGHWGLETGNIGIQLDVLPPKLDATEQSADKLDVTLAALAGQMGGAVGQSINLFQSMRQTNDALEEGEEVFSTTEVAVAGIAVGFHAVGQAVGGTAGKVLGALGDIAQGFATGGPVGAIMAGIGALAGALAGIGGPSEEEKAARANYADMHAHIQKELSGTQKFADEVQVAINQGWDTTLAETRAGFILFGTDAGLTYDQAFADYERYQQAVGAGNTALMEQIEADYARYREASEEANEAASRAWESASNAAVSAFRASEDAGVSAYDEIFEKAIASGHGQEEAVAQATAAQLAASAEVIAAKREEYAFDAAMNAAMSLGANATAEERKSAARDAATVARESWGAAMDAVADSDQAASDAMNETWDPESGDVVTDTRGAADAIVLKIEQAERDLQIQFEKMSAAAGTEAQSIESSFNSIEIKDQSFTIREHRQFSYSGFQEFGKGGPEGRQHGGPVGAGQSVIVGEAGPEIFTPGRSGSVTSNRSIPSAEEIGAAVARAMQRAPLVVPRDAVTDAVLGNSPSRQALAGYL